MPISCALGHEHGLRGGPAPRQNHHPDQYRCLQKDPQHIRWMLGTLAHDHGDEIAYAELPELEKLMLHRLSELDQLVRKGYVTISISSASSAR